MKRRTLFLLLGLAAIPLTGAVISCAALGQRGWMGPSPAGAIPLANLHALPFRPDYYGDWELSPDGHYLAVTWSYWPAGSGPSDGTYVRLLDLTSSDVITVTRPAGPGYWEGPVTVSWVSTTTLVIDRSYGVDDPRWHYVEFWSLDPWTGAEQRITRAPVETPRDDPSWTPDGRWGIFPSNPQDGIFPYLTLLDTQSGLSRRVDFPLAIARARWSPDGTQLAVVAGKMPGRFYPQYSHIQGAVYVIPAERILAGDSIQMADMRRVWAADVYGYAGTAWVSWSPDGRWLTFEWTDRNTHGIWIIPSDATLKAALLISGDFYLPIWYPDGKRLLVAVPRPNPGDPNLKGYSAFYEVDVSPYLSAP